jgi:hypothetical protein
MVVPRRSPDDRLRHLRGEVRAGGVSMGRIPFNDVGVAVVLGKEQADMPDQQ